VSRQKQYRNDELLRAIGSRIRGLRVAAGLSQQKFADLCELELSQVNRIELGKINTSISHLFLIAQNLNVPLESIVKG
jgi:transcriptional regulator with XRE-family HTH domain